MASKHPKLNDEMKEIVLQEYSKGQTCEQLSAWLLKNYDISIHYTSVARYLKKARSERKEIALTAYANSVADTATMDLQKVDKAISNFDSAYQNALLDQNLSSANQLAKTLLQYIQFRASLSGVNIETYEIENPDKQSLIQGILDKIKK